MIIPRHLIDQLIAHATAEAPHECCGMIGCRSGEAVKVYPATNAAESEVRYEIDGVDQMAIASVMDADGLELGAIYHSHTHAPPVPSETDIATAFYPDAVYVIIGRRFGRVQGTREWSEPVVRAFRIVGGVVTEEKLVVGR